MLRPKLSGTNSGFLTFRVSTGVFGDAQGQVWFASRKEAGSYISPTSLADPPGAGLSPALSGLNLGVSWLFILRAPSQFNSNEEPFGFC
jgi:hypothetical protein